MAEIKGPAPRPCESCPYRKDVPSGVWSASEYRKLLDYDLETHHQPMMPFQCHQNGADSEKSQLCAGWVACHGERLMALRLGVAMERIDASVMEYETDVPVFLSGADAASHGMRDIMNPGPEARALAEKIASRREDVTYG